MNSSRTRAIRSAPSWRLPLTIHIVSLALAFAVLMYLARHIWFIYDEWEFLAGRIVTGNLQVFTPHNEHWSTIPLLIDKGLFSAFGARTHVPYMATLIILHLGIATALWAIMRRAGADPVVIALLTLLFLFLGAGHDSILWASQIGFNCSVLFGLIQLVLVDHDKRFGLRDVGGWVAGTLALMSSGIGLPMLAAAAVAALLRRGWRGMIVTASVPAVVYAWWLIAVGYRALGSDHISLTEALHLPVYIWMGLTTSLDGATGMVGAGAVLLLGLLAWALTRGWPLRRELVVPLSAAAGSIALFALIGLARLAVIGAVVPARYVYIAIALLLPLAVVALSSATRRGPLVRWGVAALIALMLIQGAGVLRQQAGGWRATSEASRQRILGAAQLIATGQPVVGGLPDPGGAPNLTTDELRSMVAHGQIRGEAPPTAAAALEVAALMQVSLGPGAGMAADPSRATLATVAGARLARLGPGCVLLMPDSPTAHVDVQVSGPAEVSLTPDRAASLTAEVRPRDGDLAAPVRLSDDAPAGAAAYLQVTNPALRVTVVIPTNLAVCGVQT
jgi:hypothetical protein